MRGILEQSLEDRGSEYIEAHGGHCVKVGQGGKFDDIIFWGGSRHFWVEYKKEKTGHKRAAQKLWYKYLRAIGDEAYFVDTFEEVVNLVAHWTLLYGPARARPDDAFNPR